MNSAQGNRTESDRSGVELFTLYRIDMLHICFRLAKETFPRVQESDNEIPFQKWGRSARFLPFTLRAERSKKLSDTERITFGIGAFQFVIVTRIVPERWGSSVNRTAIRYGFRGATIIDSV